MQISLSTKYDIGDRIRIMYDQRKEHVIECPFCKGNSIYHTGIYKEEPRLIGDGPVEEEILECKNCRGTGVIRIRTDDVKRITQKGIYEITGFRNIDFRGEAYYEMKLVDAEGTDRRIGSTTCEHDFRIIPESEGFAEKELAKEYTYGKSLSEMIQEIS